MRLKETLGWKATISLCFVGILAGLAFALDPLAIGAAIPPLFGMAVAVRARTRLRWRKFFIAEATLCGGGFGLAVIGLAIPANASNPFGGSMLLLLGAALSLFSVLVALPFASSSVRGAVDRAGHRRDRKAANKITDRFAP